MAAIVSSKTQEMPYFPSLSIYLAMQYMNFMHLDMPNSKFSQVQNLYFANKILKIFKMAAFYKMATKTSTKRQQMP